MSTIKLITLITILATLLIATLVYIYLGGRPTTKKIDQPSSQSTGNITPTPVSPSTDKSARISIQTSSSTSIAVMDFLKSTSTIEDRLNPGHYTLVGSLDYCLSDGTCPKSTKSPEFSIEYNAKYQLFDILLLKNPLGTSRKKAEQFLLSTLDIEPAQLCQLRSSVQVTYWVNETYTGRELGLSFCPGSVELPE